LEENDIRHQEEEEEEESSYWVRVIGLECEAITRDC